MNTVEATTIIPRTEFVETMAAEMAADAPVSASKARNAGLRRALLLVAALLIAWLAFSVYTSTNELDVTLQKINASMLTESN